MAAGPRLGARRSRAALATLLAAQAAATALRAQDAVPARPRPVAVVTRLPPGAGIVLDGAVTAFHQSSTQASLNLSYLVGLEIGMAPPAR